MQLPSILAPHRQYIIFFHYIHPDVSCVLAAPDVRAPTPPTVGGLNTLAGEKASAILHKEGSGDAPVPQVGTKIDTACHI